MQEVRQAFQRIRTNPDAYPVGYRNTRRALIRRFPYAVVDLPIPEQDSIVVLSVVHCGRDPKLWQKRSSTCVPMPPNPTPSWVWLLPGELVAITRPAG